MFANAFWSWSFGVCALFRFCCVAFLCVFTFVCRLSQCVLFSLCCFTLFCAHGVPFYILLSLLVFCVCVWSCVPAVLVLLMLRLGYCFLLLVLVLVTVSKCHLCFVDICCFYCFFCCGFPLFVCIVFLRVWCCVCIVLVLFLVQLQCCLLCPDQKVNKCGVCVLCFAFLWRFSLLQTCFDFWVFACLFCRLFCARSGRAGAQNICKCVSTYSLRLIGFLSPALRPHTCLCVCFSSCCTCLCLIIFLHIFLSFTVGEFVVVHRFLLCLLCFLHAALNIEIVSST